MNERIEVGELNTLKIERQTDNGFYLRDNNYEEVLLPKIYITGDMKIGNEIEVFIYNDSEDRIVATTTKPKAMCDEIGMFKVVDTTDFGAFVDWGLPKDLFVPIRKQRTPLRKGDDVFLVVLLDEDTDRLYGSARISELFDKNTKHFKPNDEVEITIYEKTPMGFRVIINNTYEGLIFNNEIFEKLNIGDKKKAYIKMVRSDDKLDISLQVIGEKKIEATSQKVIDVLKANKGTLKMTYKSDPDLINKMFGMSRKSYKKVLTQLIESKQLVLDETSITLV
jgi:uncharacterized protein